MVVDCVVTVYVVLNEFSFFGIYRVRCRLNLLNVGICVREEKQTACACFLGKVLFGETLTFFLKVFRLRKVICTGHEPIRCAVFDCLNDTLLLHIDKFHSRIKGRVTFAKEVRLVLKLCHNSALTKITSSGLSVRELISKNGRTVLRLKYLALCR